MPKSRHFNNMCDCEFRVMPQKLQADFVCVQVDHTNSEKSPALIYRLTVSETCKHRWSDTNSKKSHAVLSILANEHFDQGKTEILIPEHTTPAPWLWWHSFLYWHCVMNDSFPKQSTCHTWALLGSRRAWLCAITALPHPSCLHTKAALSMSQKLSHTVTHVSLFWISTVPKQSSKPLTSRMLSEPLTSWVTWPPVNQRKWGKLSTHL